MKDKIRKFIKSDEKILLIPHDNKHNVLYQWTKVRHPMHTFKNFFVIRLCKYMPLSWKVFMFRHFLGMKIGRNVGISPDVDMDAFYPELISFDEGVIIGWKVNILCHEFTEENIRLGRVHFGRHCLVGAFSSIRSGVTIGEHAVVAMDSFVNKDIPPYEIWGGVPAKFIKKIEHGPADVEKKFDLFSIFRKK